MAQKYLTTEQLMEAALKTVQQMSPKEKAEVRWYLDLEMRAYLATRKNNPWNSPDLSPSSRSEL